MRAAATFDYRPGNKLSTYALHWIQQSLEQTPSDRYPGELLSNVCWSCDADRYPDVQAFNAEVRRHQIEVFDEDRWRPDELVLHEPAVDIQFMCSVRDEQVEPILRLEADDGQGFTALELFWKLCDGLGASLIANDTRLYDHHFFEGLRLWNERDSEPVPHYFVSFGS